MIQTRWNSILATSLLTAALLPGCVEDTDPGSVKNEAGAADYQEILNVLSKAEITFDEGDFAGHEALWAEFAFESPFTEAYDRDAYMTFLRGFYEQTQTMGGTRHHIVNPVVEITGDQASFTGYLYVVNRTNGSFMGSSVMRDRLEKTPEGWRFIYRSVELDQQVTQSAANAR